MNRYNLVTAYDRIYNNIELVIKFDCKDKWIFKDEDGRYIVISSEDIRFLEPKNEMSNINIYTIIELIDSEIKQMKNECTRIEENFKLFNYNNDWFRADGALKELEKLKRKVVDCYNNEKRKGD